MSEVEVCILPNPLTMVGKNFLNLLIITFIRGKFSSTHFLTSPRLGEVSKTTSAKSKDKNSGDGQRVCTQDVGVGFLWVGQLEWD